MNAVPDFSVKALSRAALPDWPRLMPLDMAAAYVGLKRTCFEAHGPAPKRVGRRKLYDRHDLDRWADALGGQPLDEHQAAEESKEVERRWRARRNKGATNDHPQP